MRTRYSWGMMVALLLLLIGLFLPISAQEATPTIAPTDAPTPTPSAALPQIAAPLQRPIAMQTLTQDGLTLELYFDRLLQGRVGLMRLSGDPLTEARVRFREHDSRFFYVPNDDAYYALIVANIDQTANREYDFTVMAQKEDGASVSIPGKVRVVLGGFIRQDVTVSGDRAFLIDPVLERSEIARLFGIFSEYTEEKLWGDTGFQYPINDEITSPFGAFRTFNGTTETRHTGWDIRAAIGTPVQAMGAGKVVFAGLLDIRGNYIIIDHGYGIYSGYAHFSQVHVTQGQTVQRGQIIGVTGNTGRSSGPHLHWEVAVNGEWVDSVDFLEMWLP